MRANLAALRIQALAAQALADAGNDVIQPLQRFAIAGHAPKAVASKRDFQAFFEGDLQRTLELLRWRLGLAGVRLCAGKMTFAW